MSVATGKKRGRPAGSVNRVPGWVRDFAIKWAGEEYATKEAAELARADIYGCARVYLQRWRLSMGLSERTLGARAMSVSLAAAWVDVPARTWESWEAGRALPAPYLWKLLRMLLRDARAGALQGEDEPAGVNPGVAWRGVKPLEKLTDPE